MQIIISIVISFLLGMLGSAFIAKYGSSLSLVDLPNQRSSHFRPTPRGGGLGILLSVLIIGFFGIRNWEFAILAGIVGILGFLEDRFNLSIYLRFLVQLVISVMIVWLYWGWQGSVLPAALFVFWVIFITGTEDFYNFMDGINGIAGLTGVVGFGLLAYYAFFMGDNPDIVLMSLVMLSGCVGFLPFNFPKARVFMGDVGSTLLGFVFAAFVLKLSTTINAFLCVTMFLYTFYADAIVTIFYRWICKESLMKAHRSHLYQYLCNELKVSHWKVSALYAVCQLVIGLLAIWAYKMGLSFQIVLYAVCWILFIYLYRLIKRIKPRKVI